MLWKSKGREVGWLATLVVEQRIEGWASALGGFRAGNVWPSALDQTRDRVRSELAGAASWLLPITENRPQQKSEVASKFLEVERGGSNCWKVCLRPGARGGGCLPPKRRAALGMAAPRAEAGNA